VCEVRVQARVRRALQLKFGDALVEAVGVEQKGHSLCMDLPHSGGCSVVLFPVETTTALLWTALPSRTEVTLPGDLSEQVERARTAHHRFGQHVAQWESVLGSNSG